MYEIGSVNLSVFWLLGNGSLEYDTYETFLHLRKRECNVNTMWHWNFSEQSHLEACGWPQEWSWVCLWERQWHNQTALTNIAADIFYVLRHEGSTPFPGSVGVGGGKVWGRQIQQWLWMRSPLTPAPRRVIFTALWLEPKKSRGSSLNFGNYAHSRAVKTAKTLPGLSVNSDTIWIGWLLGIQWWENGNVT